MPKTSKQGKWFNSATGYGTLGYAPPASIGAKLAKPKKPVICIVGDGGLQFSLSELMTASEEKIAVIFLIWNNFGYKEIRNFMVSENVGSYWSRYSTLISKFKLLLLTSNGLINGNNLVKTLKTIREEKPSILKFVKMNISPKE